MAKKIKKEGITQMGDFFVIIESEDKVEVGFGKCKLNKQFSNFKEAETAVNGLLNTPLLIDVILAAGAMILNEVNNSKSNKNE